MKEINLIRIFMSVATSFPQSTPNILTSVPHIQFKIYELFAKEKITNLNFD